MPSKLKKAIGAVKDHTSISLAKVASNNTSNLEVVVLKATTHEDIPIDDRYVHEILILVSSNKIYAAACARAIGKRIGRTRNWIVALKSLMLVLRIFQDGDPYFPREVLHSMKRGAKILNLSSFRDDSNSSPWDFTAFVRTFALYLDERLDCFLTGKLQRRYTHHKVRDQTYDSRIRRANEPVRDMKPAMLLDRISYWQRLLERAIATRPTGAAKMNRLVQISLYSVVQESFDLYKDISDGLALMLDSFFHLQYQNCVSAFQTCVKAAKQFEELSAFYSLCKSIGVGRTSEYPSVQTVSEELLETLQEFLKDQSSFPASNIRSPNRILLLPAQQIINSKSGRHDSYGTQSDFSELTSTDNASSQCTSLEDLISATEVTVTNPSISIDLEAYNDQFEEVHAQRDGNFPRLSESGSTQSLPVSYSIVDLVSLDDWSIHEENEHNKQKQEPGQEKTVNAEALETSSTAKGWELVLVESITSTTTQSSLIIQNPPTTSTFNAFSESITTQLDNAPKPPTDTFNAFSESIITTQPVNAPKPPTNTFSALSEPIRTTQLANALHTHETDTFSSFSKLITTTQTEKMPNHRIDTFNAFSESTTNELNPPSSEAKEQTVTTPSTDLDGLFNVNPNPSSIPPSNHYNPFLQDATELASTSTPTTNFQIGFPSDVTNNSEDFFASAPTFQASGFSTPTFQASDFPPPTFSARNSNSTIVAREIQNDPFVVYSNSEQQQLFSGSMNQQKLLHEQQLWLQNQNKIIAKHIA